MLSVPEPGTIGWVAGGLGLVGLFTVVVGVRRRRSAMAMTLMAAFVLLFVGGALLARPSEATRPWGLAIVGAGAVTACIAAMSMARRDGALSLAADSAVAAAASNKRELDALLAVKGGLEEQLASARKRLSDMLEKAEHEGPVEPVRIRRYRERIGILKASEEKLRQVIDVGRDGIVMLENETLRMARFTPSVARMTGHGPEVLVDMTILEVLEHGVAEPGRADLQRIAHERRPLAAKIVRADGTRLPIEISVVPVGEGDEAQLMALLRDVSEQAALRQQVDALRGEVADRERRLDGSSEERARDAQRVRDLEAQLAALRSAKAQAVEAVAHDLRVPLTSVRSFSEILLRHEDADPKVQREFLDIIRKESERLTGMIDELLDVRRIGAGADELRHDDLDLRDVLGETIAALQGLAQERGVTFQGVWDREARIVRGDRERLRRMVENLLSNAVQFNSEGGAVEILLRGGRKSGGTLLGIRDHGPGIPEEDQEIVFERFHRASAGPGLAPGCGLGLSICREIAAAHGAVLWPESRGTGGSTLWVEFPPPDEMQSALDGDVALAAGIAHA